MFSHLTDFLAGPAVPEERGTVRVGGIKAAAVGADARETHVPGPGLDLDGLLARGDVADDQLAWEVPGDHSFPVGAELSPRIRLHVRQSLHESPRQRVVEA